MCAHDFTQGWPGVSRWSLKLLDQVKDIAQEAGRAILDIYQQDDVGIQTKRDQSPLTQADLASHDIITKALKQLTPDIPILSEEGHTLAGEVDTFWCVDPLDGTKEFIQRNGEFTCNLALIDARRTIYGFVSVPVLGLLYHGGHRLGAKRLQRDGSESVIQCTKQADLTRVVASKSHLNPETEAFIATIETPVLLIQAGSSLKFLRIAEGAADLYPRLAPTCEWDTAAAQAILEGAGGSVTQLDNSSLVYGKSNILNPHFVAKAH